MKRPNIVVDLHIEKIARGYRNFSPADSLIYQKELFERTLRANRLKKGMEIVFIHGVGAGVLREELIKILQQKFPEFLHDDASFALFGYQGALHVTIR